MKEIRPEKKPAGQLALAVLGGLTWGFCFERVAVPELAWIALLPGIVLLGSRRPALACWLLGAVSWFVMLRWIPNTLHVYGALPEALSWLLLVPLSFVLGAYMALWGGLGAALWRRGGWAATLGIPALWVALEWMRAHAFSGFPWNLAAYAWTEQLGALSLAPWLGSYGISGLIVFVNVGLAVAWQKRSLERALWLTLGVLAILVLAARWSPSEGALESRAVASRTGGALDSGGETVLVTIVQPNTQNQISWDPQIALENYDRLIRLSDEVCDDAPRLLLWPESAAFPFHYSSEPRLRADLDRLASRGCTVLMNSATRRGDRYFNSVLLVTSSGLEANYDKRHLVPFGEYVPLADVFGFIESLARNAGDFSPGESADLLRFDRGVIGAALCYEVIFPAEVAELVREGADLLVTLTNDAWYGDTAAPWQHFRAARFRAAESRRYVLRAAITGVSGVIDSSGRVVERLGVGELGTISSLVVRRSDLTWHSRAPWAVPLLASIVALFAIFRCRRDRRASVSQ